MANKVKAVYGPLGHDIPTEAWDVAVTPAERLLILELTEKIPRPMRAVEPTSPAPGAP